MINLTAEEYRTLVEFAPVLIWRSGEDGRCDYFNDAWLRYTGRTPEQERGDGWLHGVHPDDARRVETTYRGHFDRREPFELRYRLRRADGMFRYLLDRGAPFFTASGAFGGYIGSCVDVHETFEAVQQRLRAEAEFHRRVGDVAHDCNNPLAFAISNLKYLAEALEQGTTPPDATAAAQEALSGLERIRRRLLELEHGKLGTL